MAIYPPVIPTVRNDMNRLRTSISTLLLIIAPLITAPSLASAALPKIPERCACGQTARKGVCPKDVPKSVSYRPSSALCNNKAAVLLRGSFVNSFSVVVRDSQNRDRWPASGYGGCSAAVANSNNPPARCSAFKASGEFTTRVGGVRTRVVCFPEAGTSRLWQDVRRITIKGENTAASIRRFCVAGAGKPLN